MESADRDDLRLQAAPGRALAPEAASQRARLTAEDVKYTYERFLNVPGNPNRAQLEEVDKIEALDRYTVKFSLKEPYAWFLDALATLSMCIIAKEVVEHTVI